jgi:hypothetical protein
MVVDEQPLFFPLNYALGHRIVTFEVYESERSTSVGWSVFVRRLNHILQVFPPEQIAP